jgi:hypothetical protein
MKPYEDEALAEIFEVCAAEVQRSHAPDDWFLNSGASAHVTGNRDLLTDVRTGPNSTITTAAEKSLPIVGQGQAYLNNKAVQRVLYVPGMCKNLISVGKFADQGHLTLFGAKKYWILE